MEETVFDVRRLSVSYDGRQALKGVSLRIPRFKVTAVIGPSGCGKSTLLRCFNRMNDLIPGSRVEGEVLFEGENIYDRGADVTALRRRVGMVFQKPNPFPKSIFENVAFGLRIHGYRKDLRERVETALRKAALWDEVRDRLSAPAHTLSGGQQQRLCIARALALEPEVLLMDEPTSALDPAAAARIEDLIAQLKESFTVVVVTHNMQQAARIADYTAFLLDGELVEWGPTVEIFTRPRDRRTEEYVTGRFG